MFSQAATTVTDTYERGSHFTLSAAVHELKRDRYQLEKENKALKNETEASKQHIEHYKNKAQQWKTSSLLHQKSNSKLKAEIANLQQRVTNLTKEISDVSIDNFRKRTKSPLFVEQVQASSDSSKNISAIPSMSTSVIKSTKSAVDSSSSGDSYVREAQHHADGTHSSSFASAAKSSTPAIGCVKENTSGVSHKISRPTPSLPKTLSDVLHDKNKGVRTEILNTVGDSLPAEPTVSSYIYLFNKCKDNR